MYPYIRAKTLLFPYSVQKFYSFIKRACALVAYTTVSFSIFSIGPEIQERSLGVKKKKKNLSLLVISSSSCIAYAAASGNVTRVKRERREKGHGRGKGSRVSNFHPLC